MLFFSSFRTTHFSYSGFGPEISSIIMMLSFEIPARVLAVSVKSGISFFSYSIISFL